MAWFSTLDYISTGDYVLGTDVAGQPDGVFNALVDKVHQNTLELASIKLDKAGGTITGSIVVQGNLTVQGDTFEQGQTYITDNIQVINSGEAGAGISLGFGGIEIDRGTSTNAQLVYDESVDAWKYGLSGALIQISSRLSNITGDGNATSVALNFEDGSVINWNASHSHTASDCNAYSQLEIDNFFEGELGDKKQVAWSSLVNVPTAYTSSEGVRDLVIANGVYPKGTIITYNGVFNNSHNLKEVEMTDNSVPAVGIIIDTLQGEGVDTVKGDPCYILTIGKLTDFNTSAWTQGAVLYVDGAGDFTDVKPTTGFAQACAYVSRSHNTQGELQINFHSPLQSAYEVRYNNATSGLTATDVKGAIDELSSSLGSVNQSQWTTVDAGIKYELDNVVGIGTSLVSDDYSATYKHLVLKNSSIVANAGSIEISGGGRYSQANGFWTHEENNFGNLLISSGSILYRQAYGNAGDVASFTNVFQATTEGIYENGTLLSTKYAPYTHSHPYLPLTGGTLSGQLTVSSNILLTDRGTDYALRTPDWRIYNTEAGNALAFSNYTDDVMTLKNGHLGVGTSDPLHNIVSKVSANQYAYQMLSTTGANQGGLYVDSTRGSELYLITAGSVGSIYVTASGSSYFNGGAVLFNDNVARTSCATQISANQDLLSLYEPDGILNKRLYDLIASTGQLRIRAKNDSNAYLRDIITFSHDGYVGVGTTPNSLYKLGVAGKIRASDQVIGQSFWFYADTNTGISPSGTDYLGIYAGGDLKASFGATIYINSPTKFQSGTTTFTGGNVTIDASGNITTVADIKTSTGIRNSNGSMVVNMLATSGLRLGSGSTSLPIDFHIGDSGTTLDRKMRLANTDNGLLTLFDAIGNPKINLNTNGTTEFFGGNFVIGSALSAVDSDNKLQVDGDINISGGLFINGTAFSGSQWTENTANGIEYSDNVGIGVDAESTNKLRIQGAGGGGYPLLFLNTETPNSSQPIGMVMRSEDIGGNGNTYGLAAVSASSSGGTDDYMSLGRWTGTAFNPNIVIGHNGNIGVNITNPQTYFHLHTPSSATSQMQFTTLLTGTSSTRGLSVGISNAEAFITNWEGTPLNLRSGTGNIKLFNTGKVLFDLDTELNQGTSDNKFQFNGDINLADGKSLHINGEDVLGDIQSALTEILGV